MENYNKNTTGSGGSNMFKRIVAIIGIVLLIGLYVNLFLQAMFGRPDAFGAFISAAAATIAIPIAIWLILWVYTSITGKRTVASASHYENNEQKPQEVNPETVQKNEPDNITEEDNVKEEEPVIEDTPVNAEKAVPEDDGKIDTVIFDIGGVLADFCWDEFIKDKGYVEDTVDRIAKASIGTPEWDEFDRGILDTPDIIRGFVKNDPEIEEELFDVYSDLTGLLRKKERSIPWIRALKAAGYRVLVLSNYSKQAEETNPFMQEFLSEVDGGILSYKEKVIKPDRRIYELITERYNLVPSKCVFIDDIERNVQAARDFGMNSIQFVDYEQVDAELSDLGVRYSIS